MIENREETVFALGDIHPVNSICVQSILGGLSNFKSNRTVTQIIDNYMKKALPLQEAPFYTSGNFSIG